MIKYHDKLFFDVYSYYLQSGETHEEALYNAYQRQSLNIFFFLFSVITLLATGYSFFDKNELIKQFFTYENSLIIKVTLIIVFLSINSIFSYFLMKYKNRKEKIIKRFEKVSPCVLCAHLLTLVLFISVCLSMYLFLVFL